jgi:subtilisin family serine protease
MGGVMRGSKLFIGILLSLLFINGGIYIKQVEASSLENAPTPAGGHTLSSEVRDQLNSLAEDEMLTVIVTLAGQADLNPANSPGKPTSIVQQLQRNATFSQASVVEYLQEMESDGLVQDITPFWIFNGIALTASSQVIQDLGNRPDVIRIDPNRIFYAPNQPVEEASHSSNIEIINAPAMWEMGYRGQGIVVANMDTGVFGDHPDLAETWRGGTNSWYDPSGEYPDTPHDVDGHGTWTMGVMVGGESSGRTLGVAPEAKWIAVRIFDNDGLATSIRIHQGYQWLLDPDGDPSTDDAPHVVNNSWAFQSIGCFLDFQADILALRSAGILPIFAAGNAGPEPNSSLSPSNNPGALSVGAIDHSDLVTYSSSRGPSQCAPAGEVFPSIVAPGMSIHTTGLYNNYTFSSGTSLSAPHVAGALALLLSADPDLNVEEQERIILDSAFDLGVQGPDNDYGYGRLDVINAYRILAGTPVPPAQPSTNELILYLPMVGSR